MNPPSSPTCPVNIRHPLLLAVLALSLCGTPTPAFARKTWSFNWYCSGCGKLTGGRTTGTVGPFASESECENARSDLSRRMGAQGGGVDAMPCYYEGYDDPVPDAPRRPGSGTVSPRQEEQMPAYDEEAARQAQRQAEEERRRKEEAERRAAEERQQQFIRERDAAAGSLKGRGSAPFGIKGSPDGDLRIKAGAPDRQPRDVSTGWKQLHCAADLSLHVLAAARSERPAMEEVRYLSSEALKSLNGERLGVACPETPAPPAIYGKEPAEPDALRRYYTELLDAVAGQAQQRVTLRQKLAELEDQRMAAEAELAQLRDTPPQSFDIVDLSQAGTLTVPLLATPPRSASSRLQVPVPPPPKPERPFWLSATALTPMDRSQPAVRDYLAALAGQATQGYNLMQDAFAAYLARLDPETRRRALGLNAFWFQQSMQQARDRLLNEEYQAIQAAALDAYQQLDAELRRQQHLQASLEARRAEGERHLQAASEGIMAAHRQARNAAFDKAQQQLLQEIRGMEARGLLKRSQEPGRLGEDILLREQRDPAFRQVMAAAVDRVRQQLDADYLTAHQQAIAAYNAEAQRLKAAGLLPEPMTDAERQRRLDAYALQVSVTESEATRAARERTRQGLAEEFQRLKAMEPRMLKRAETAIVEVDKLIRGYQAREQRAQRNLEHLQQSAEAVLARPTPASLSIPKAE